MTRARISPSQTTFVLKILDSSAAKSWSHPCLRRYDIICRIALMPPIIGEIDQIRKPAQDEYIKGKAK